MNCISSIGFFFLVSFVSLLPAQTAPEGESHFEGEWVGELLFDAYLRPIRVNLSIHRAREESFKVRIVNATEVIDVPEVERTTRGLRIKFTQYDSEIELHNINDAGEIEGMFVRKRGNSRQDVRGIFAACRASSVRPVVEPIQFDGCTILGDWRVSFGNGENAIARISEEYATFLTNTGDYRFMPRIVGLETDWRTYVPKQNHIAYSVFDGAHAFRFDARVEEIAGECKMTGTFFYAPDTVVDFTAVRDDDAKLPDGFSLTTATRDNLAGLAFPDLAGNSQKITELLAGNPGIIEIFGSWCPNCHDAAELLAELDKKHRDQGLRIIGLAFEYADEFEKQAARVKTYLARHKINFPILIAGEADKEKATQSLAVLDRIRAFPTFLFIDRSGKIRAIYSGFSGPATGEEHKKLKAAFEKQIQQLVKE